MNNNVPLQQMKNNPNYSHFLTQTALYACGFQQATRSTTPTEIWNIHPHGGTAMRDALIYGDDLMLKLHDLLERQHTAANWNFLHIMITDGHDTDSRTSYQTCMNLMSSLRNRVNVSDLKVVILGVDIEWTYANQLRVLAAAAGLHGEYHDITHTDITRMFQRIRAGFGLSSERMNMGVMNQMGANQYPMNQPAMTNYAVLFNLDISGSMTGHKWEVTRHAVIDFIRYLGNNDVVSAIVFNDYPHLVMHWNTRQNQMKMGQMGNTQPFQQIMNFEAFYDPAENMGYGNVGGNAQFNAGRYNNGGVLRQPLNTGVNNRYVVTDPYNDDCCCNVM